MSVTLLDFSERGALKWLSEVIAAVQASAGDLPLLLVGAMARDLLLLHAHGIDTARASYDVDLGIAAPDWAAFLGLRGALLASGAFTPGRVPHIVLFRGARRVDLIPFGAVEREDRTIAWPPEGAEVMNVFGFSEALRSAEVVRLPDGITARVVSLPALAVLKVVAWHDRRRTFPGKDAADIWLLLRNYAEAGNEDLIYTNCITQLESAGFDQDRAGAWLLGADARRVMELGDDRDKAIAVVREILEPEVDPDGPLGLVGQMPSGDKDRQLALLRDFLAGIVGSNP